MVLPLLSSHHFRAGDLGHQESVLGSGGSAWIFFLPASFGGHVKHPLIMIIAAGALIPWKFALDAYQNTNAVIAGYSSTKGEVVEYASRMSRSAGSGSSSAQFYPVVHFTAANGELMRFESEYGAGDIRYPIGEPVEVLYDPSDPQSAVINEFRSLWLQTLMFFGFGLPFLIFAAYLYFRSRKS